MNCQHLSLAELDILDHATAWSRTTRSARARKLKRNYFCSSEGSPDRAAIEALIARGLMELERPDRPSYSRVTPAGIEVLRRWRP